MSKIISLINSGASSVSVKTVDDKMNERETIAAEREVDESMFDDSRLVTRIFEDVLYSRRLRANAEEYDVIVLDSSDTRGLSALPGVGDEIASHVEVSDVMWEHLSDNSQSMQVFLDNMLVNPSKIDFSDEARATYTDALDKVEAENEVISSHIDRARRRRFEQTGLGYGSVSDYDWGDEDDDPDCEYEWDECDDPDCECNEDDDESWY